MKKTGYFTLGFIIIISLFLTACPYKSSISLSQANIEYSDNLIGDWILQDGLFDNPNYLHITHIDNVKFKVEHYEYDEKYELLETFTCHFTNIGDARFINALDIESMYNFYRVYISDNSLTLHQVTNNIDEVFTDSKELYNFFEENKDLSFFYNTANDIYIKGSVAKESKIENTKNKLGDQLKSN
jgi:hypothetical protein